MKKIIITGGNGRFAKTLQKKFFGKQIKYLKKKEFDILNFKKINNYLKINKINIVVHAAALSRPMDMHDKDINKSINLNIIGTSNVVMACKNNNAKIIYLSTNYVYPCKKGNYKENDPLLPINNYGWSKLGGEAAVHMYKNSLILRLCMTEKPFIHKKAFKNILTNFIYHDEFANFFKKIINKKGIINIGGKTQSIFNFAKKNNLNVIPIKSCSIYKNQSICINKLKKILKK